MEETVIFGPKRLSEFVALLYVSPSAGDLDRLRSEGVRAVLDTRQASDETGALGPDLLAAALTERGMAYARLPLMRTHVDDAVLDRFGQVIKSLPKPMVLVSPEGTPGGLFAMAHIAIEQGMPGESMLEAARTMGVLCGSHEFQQFVSDYVDQHNKRVNKLEQRAAQARRGAPVASEPHQRGVIMHTEVKAIAEPLSYMSVEPKVQMVASASVLGLLAGLLVDRRLLLIPFCGIAYLVGRAWPLVSKPVALATEAVVPEREVELLRARLEKLRAAS